VVSNMSNEVTLTQQDVRTCDQWARKRHVERTKAGQEAKIKFHQIGCYGEYAVVKHFDCEWTGRYYEGDSWKERSWDTEVGEVRATFRPDLYDGMRIYPSDFYNKAPYIWVTCRRYGSAVKARLVGWYWLEEGKKPEWWRPDVGKHGAWIVPRSKLRPMDTLPNIGHENSRRPEEKRESTSQ
jgi:hypothetical protein